LTQFEHYTAANLAIGSTSARGCSIEIAIRVINQACDGISTIARATLEFVNWYKGASLRGKDPKRQRQLADQHDSA
jgi:hypothetical protein